MAPESERANTETPNCKHCGRVIYWHSAGMWAHYDDVTARCDLRAEPAPTPLTCSEVVERLLEECHHVGAPVTCHFSRSLALAILHSWRDAELLKVVGQDRFHLRKQIEEREQIIEKLTNKG